MDGQALFITSSGKSGGSEASINITNTFCAERIYGGKAMRLIALLNSINSVSQDKLQKLNLHAVLDSIRAQFAELTDPIQLEKALLENPSQFLLADVPNDLLDCVELQDYFKSDEFKRLNSKLKESDTNLDKQVDFAILNATLEHIRQGKLTIVESKSLNYVIYNFRNGLPIPDGWYEVLEQLSPNTKTIYLYAPLEVRAQRSVAASLKSNVESICHRSTEIWKEMISLAKRTFVDAVRYYEAYGTPYPATQEEQDIAIAAAISDSEKVEIAKVDLVPAEQLNDFVFDVSTMSKEEVPIEIARTLKINA